MQTTIYALCEPGTRTVRYIGKTIDLKRRFTTHLRVSAVRKNHLGGWLRSLAARSELPNMVTLREVPETEGSAAEVKYIRIARGLGMDLCNATDGGDFMPDNTGSKRTPEQRAARSARMTGQTLPPEWRASMSAARIGVPRPAGMREKISAALTGRRQSEETRAKKRASQQRRREQEKLAGKKSVPWSAVRRAAFENRKKRTN